MPLEKQEEHPHVYWSVPAHWFPGGVVFDADDWSVLVHAVLRVADPRRRERLLTRLLAGRRSPVASADGIERLHRAVAATPFSADEHEMVLLVERSVLEDRALSIYYYSASKGQLAWRTISPQRMVVEPFGRVAAYCHANKTLRWFRIGNIQRARLDDEQKRVHVPEPELDAFIETSVNGYSDGTDEELAFRVKPPESGWVRSNLLPGMTIDTTARGGELRVVARGAALVVARFIVGLGGAGVAEGTVLRSLVRKLASDAMAGNQD